MSKYTGLAEVVSNLSDMTTEDIYQTMSVNEKLMNRLLLAIIKDVDVSSGPFFISCNYIELARKNIKTEDVYFSNDNPLYLIEIESTHIPDGALLTLRVKVLQSIKDEDDITTWISAIINDILHFAEIYKYL